MNDQTNGEDHRPDKIKTYLGKSCSGNNFIQPVGRDTIHYYINVETSVGLTTKLPLKEPFEVL